MVTGTPQLTPASRATTPKAVKAPSKASAAEAAQVANPTSTPAIANLPQGLQDALNQAAAGNSDLQQLQTKALDFLRPLLAPNGGWSAQLAAFQQKLVTAAQAAGITVPPLTMGQLDPQNWTITMTTNILQWAEENHYGYNVDAAVNQWTAAYKYSQGAQGPTGNAWPIPVAMPSQLDVASATDSVFEQLMGRRATVEEQAAVAAIIDRYKPTAALATKAGTVHGAEIGLGGPAAALSQAQGNQPLDAYGNPIPSGAPPAPRTTADAQHRGVGEIGQTAGGSQGGPQPPASAPTARQANRGRGNPQAPQGQHPQPAPVTGTVNSGPDNPANQPAQPAPTPTPAAPPGSDSSGGNAGYQFVPYIAPPSPTDAAEQYALQNEAPEVNGMFVANVLNDWAQFVRQA